MPIAVATPTPNGSPPASAATGSTTSGIGETTNNAKATASRGCVRCCTAAKPSASATVTVGSCAAVRPAPAGSGGSPASAPALAGAISAEMPSTGASSSRLPKSAMICPIASCSLAPPAMRSA